jgi:hypothetical protein
MIDCALQQDDALGVALRGVSLDLGAICEAKDVAEDTYYRLHDDTVPPTYAAHIHILD